MLFWVVIRWVLREILAGSMGRGEAAEMELGREEGAEAVVVVAAAEAVAMVEEWALFLARTGDDLPSDMAVEVVAVVEGHIAAGEDGDRMVLDGHQDELGGRGGGDHCMDDRRAVSFPVTVARVDNGRGERDAGHIPGSLGEDDEAAVPVVGRAAAASATVSRPIDRSGSTRGTCPSAE